MFGEVGETEGVVKESWLVDAVVLTFLSDCSWRCRLWVGMKGEALDPGSSHGGCRGFNVFVAITWNRMFSPMLTAMIEELVMKGVPHGSQIKSAFSDIYVLYRSITSNVESQLDPKRSAASRNQIIDKKTPTGQPLFFLVLSEVCRATPEAQ